MKRSIRLTQTLFQLVLVTGLAAEKALAEVPTLTPIGYLNPARPSLTARGISSDGTTVFGYSQFDADEIRAIHWTRAGGTQNLGPSTSMSPPIGTYANGANANASVIVGVFENNGVRAFRWTGAGGFVLISSQPFPESGATANDVSNDGAIVVGRANISPASRAVRWTNAGMQNLGIFAGYADSEATRVNADGSIVVGTSFNYSGGPTPSLTSEAFRWSSAAGMVSLQSPGFTNTNANGISDSGHLIVGSCQTGGAARAYRWTSSGGMQSLGVLPPSTSSAASDVTADGRFVVGSAHNPSEPILAYRNRAMLWSARTGFVDLANFLTSKGVNIENWKLSYATGVSADGRTVTGHGYRAGPQEGWVVTLPGQCYSDFNNDGVVDDADFVNFAVAYEIFACNDPAMAPWCPADLNLDNVVDDADFVEFAGAYDIFECPS